MRPVQVFRSTWNRLIPQYDNCWTIGIIDSPISAFLTDNSDVSVDWYRGNDTTKFLADQFPIRNQGRLYVFCEQFDRRESRGRIVYLELDESRGFVSEPHIAIDLQKTHLSYPFIFRSDRDVYCVLQTMENKSIALYRASAFPAEWEKVSILVSNFIGADATVFHDRERWWLASSSGGKYFADELFMWYAADPLGEWKPHEHNPVRRAAYHCRPAGTPFLMGDQLYRPTQDCSKTYGGSVTVNRITKLNTKEFHEEFTANIEPDPKGPYPEGLHTLSYFDDLTFIDGKRHCYRNSYADALFAYKGRRTR